MRYMTWQGLFVTVRVERKRERESLYVRMVDRRRLYEIKQVFKVKLFYLICVLFSWLTYWSTYQFPTYLDSVQNANRKGCHRLCIALFIFFYFFLGSLHSQLSGGRAAPENKKEEGEDR